jgi:hypothetical protein
MSNVTKYNPNSEIAFPQLSSLPQMFQNAMPPTVPQLQFRAGVIPIVSNFFHNMKLGQMEKAANLEASIAEHHVRKLRANLDGIKELILFGQKYELEVKAIRSQSRMLDLLEQQAEAELVNKQLINMEKQADVKMAHLDLKMRMHDRRRLD